MSWLRIFATLLLLALMAPAATAQDWRITSGTGRAFADAEWLTLNPGDTPPDHAEVRTGARDRMLIDRDGDSLNVAPMASFDLESDGDARVLVRVFDGAFEVSERDALGKQFIVMTASATLVAKGAEFSIVGDPTGAYVVVRRGLVEATDLATRETVQVKAGETYRSSVGRPATVEKIIKADPVAGNVAEPAATAPPGDASASSGAEALDRVSTGALPGGGGKADAKLVEQAADAVHEQRRKAKLGKGDPRAVAAVARMERDLFQDFDVETEPWDDSFQWTETEDGEVRLKPISRIVLGLHGAESFEFWVLLGLVCLILGGLTNAVLAEAGFGAICNAAVVMTAFTAAVLVRDLFFRDGANLALEPFLSMGMMLSAMPALLLSGALAKSRWDL